MMQNMKSTFAGLYTLDRVRRNQPVVVYLLLFTCFCCYLQSEEGDRVVDMALKYPDRYVLKPQREGGGK